MRIAVLCDIHGNLRALEAVLAEVATESPDLVLIGGDVAAGPFPREVLERLKAHPGRVSFIRGNADREVIAALGRPPDTSTTLAIRARWVGESLSADQRTLLSDLPLSATFDVDGLGATLFCHGSPRSDDEIITRISAEERLVEILAGVRERTVVFGHTHVQFERVVRDWRLVNPGSVGMPYEDEPGARWALLGPDVALRRTAYDVERAAEEIRASDYPEAEEFVTKYLLSPPRPGQVSELFESMAVERAAKG